MWESLRLGLLRIQAAARPAPDPASVDAIRLYATTADTERMLDSLRLIVDAHPDRIPAALEALGDPVLVDFRGDDEERMGQIVTDARQRLPDLPREEAARRRAC